MPRARVLTALLLAFSLLLSLTFFTPKVTLASSGTVTDCTLAGISQTLSQTYFSDPTTPVVVTFDCPNPVIDFGGYLAIKVPAVPITFDGANNGNPIVLDGNDDTRFFSIDDGTNFTLKNITLQNGTTNVFADGGAINVASGSSLTTISTTFLNNHAAGNGGAIYSKGSVDIIDSTFTSNSAQSTGGAIVNFQGTLDITNSSFSTNSAAYSGAIENYSSLTITGSTFTDNHALNSGGVMVNYASSATITNSTFTQNDSIDGGAIFNESSGILDILQSSFNSNTAVHNGGAIMNIGTLNVNQSGFTSNTGFRGGAISADNPSQSARISQSTFANNTANRNGGAFYLGNGPTHITASTLTGNTAQYQGSAVAAYEAVIPSDVRISWSTIVQPVDTTPALVIEANLRLEGVILAGDGSHCQFVGGDITDSYVFANDTSCNLAGTGSWQGVDNLGLDDDTTTTINGVDQTYYPLLETSPAIGAGPTTCDTNLIDGPDPDQIGNPRPYHFFCDIGAIESTFTTNMLCANQWNGSLHMADSPNCNRSETFIKLPTASPLTLCVNQWNGATRLSNRCSRSERTTIITGDRSIPACANQWNGALRLTSQCTRSETRHWL